MTSHHLSMSRLSLAHACSWSFRADAPQHPRPAGAPARIGSRTHKLMERYVKGGGLLEICPADADEETREAFAFFSPPVRGFLASISWTACEIGLRYDSQTDTCTAGPRRGEPGYDEIAPTVLPGTLDLVAVEGGVVTVADLKTGKHVTDREQLYGQAVAASRYFGVPRARVAYVYARKTKCDPPEWEELDADRLDEEAGRIARVMRRLPVAEPVPGDYCWRCDSRPSCPAFGEAQASDSASELEAAGFWA